jgi:hypothetical protein
VLTHSASIVRLRASLSRRAPRYACGSDAGATRGKHALKSAGALWIRNPTRHSISQEINNLKNAVHVLCCGENTVSSALILKFDASTRHHKQKSLALTAPRTALGIVVSVAGYFQNCQKFSGLFARD